MEGRRRPVPRDVVWDLVAAISSENADYDRKLRECQHETQSLREERAALTIRVEALERLVGAD